MAVVVQRAALALSTLLVIVSFQPIAGAWSNGGYSADPDNPDYGTHDWIAEMALDMQVLDVSFLETVYHSEFLLGTEAPDNPAYIGDSFNHHVYYYSDGSLQDDVGADRAQAMYVAALGYLSLEDYLTAAYYIGAMTHYISDVGVFGHTMGTTTDWGEEAHHSDYESEFESMLWSLDPPTGISLGDLDAYAATLGLAEDVTFGSGLIMPNTWMDVNYDWGEPTFTASAMASLYRSVEAVAAVINHFLLEVVPEDESHGPIYIMDNDDFTEENGVSSGSGTAADPYVIENLVIYADDYYGIRVYGTDKHFIICNVVVEGASNSSNGICISRAAHGAVIGCEVSGHFTGMVATDSSDISFTMSKVRDFTNNGISLGNCTHSTIMGNDISSEVESWRGVNVGLWSSMIDILNNRISHIRNHLDLGFGIGTWYADNLTIRGNYVSDCDAGICLGRTNDTTTCENSFVDNSMHVHWGSIYDNLTIYPTTWNDQYPVGGNYWSGHTGTDYLNGPQQDIPGRDGICDTPYVVMYLDSVPITDDYPLMQLVGTNRPPVASFFMLLQEDDSRFVRVDASSSWDYEDSSEDLRLRWDWQNDSQWDTEWSSDKTSEYLYQANGTYVIRLQVIDKDGVIGELSLPVDVEGLDPVEEPEVDDPSEEPEPDDDTDWWTERGSVLGVVAAAVSAALLAMFAFLRRRDNHDDELP